MMLAEGGVLSQAAAMARPALRAVLEDIFLVRRVQTVAEALALCAPLPAPRDDAALCKPVRRLLYYI